MLNEKSKMHTGVYKISVFERKKRCVPICLICVVYIRGCPEGYYHGFPGVGE